MSNPNRRGALALVSASMCLVLAALFSLGERAPPALSAAGEAAVPAAADRHMYAIKSSHERSRSQRR